MSFYDSLSAKIYLMEKHIKENEPEAEHKPWYLLKDGVFSHLKLGLYKILLALARIGLILRGKPASNFTVFTRAGKEGLYICNYSYCYYKDFHHKTRNKTIATIIAATVLLSIIISLIFPGYPGVKAATYNFSQINWSGGLDGGVYPNHTSNQSNWTKYSAKDSDIVASASNLTLANAASNFLDTTDEDFAAWYDANWTRRKAIVITENSGSTLTNYQVKITVAYDSDMQADFDDIRFADSNGSTLIDHWLESKTDSTADFWVEIPTLTASQSKTIFVYYGNASATSASNGANTFIVWDDFAPATEQWNEVDDAQNSILIDRSGTQTLKWTNSDRTSDTYVYISISGIQSFIYDFTFNLNGSTGGNPGMAAIGAVSTSPGSLGNAGNEKRVFWYGYYGSYLNLVDGESEMAYTQSTTRYGRLVRDTSKTLTFYQYLDSARTSLVSSISQDDSAFSSDYTYVLPFQGRNDGGGSGVISGWVDDIRVRKYASPEPSVGAAGAEAIATTSSSSHSNTAVSGTGAGASVAINWYNANWSYRRPITLSPATSEANYQVNVTLTNVTLTGAQLTSGNANGNDIIFTGSNGTTPQDYWIESWSATGTTVTASIWVEVAASETSTIYMYYGNPSATSASSGTNTYDFFDDFNRADGTVGNGWTTYQGSSSISGNTLRAYSNPYSLVGKPFSLSNGIVMYGKIMGNAPSTGSYQSVAVKAGTTTVHDGVGVMTIHTNGEQTLSLLGAGSVPYTLPYSTWRNFELEIATDYSMKLYFWPSSEEKPGTPTINQTAFTPTPTGTNLVLSTQNDGTPYYYYDDIRVRKYASPEPTAGAPGSETAATGTFTSSIKNTGASNYWGNIVFNTTLNGGTVTMKVRTSNSATMSGAPDWATCNTITSGTNITGNNCVTSPAQYVQYQATLNMGTSSPSLNDVTIYYGGYAPSATLTSSAFNTQNAGNVLSKLTWNEGTLPANTDIKFQIKTAPDSGSSTPGTFTAWCGPDDGVSGSCSSATYFTAPAGTETIDDINRDGYANQWIQYKVWLTSADGVSTPTLSGASPEYVINTAPAVASVTASQGSDGIVSIGYNISDAEQTSVNVSLLADIGVTLSEVLANSTDPGGGAVTVSDASFLPSSGTIQIENEQITYTGKTGNDLTGAVRAANSTKYAGHSSGTVVWIKGTTVSGSAGALTGITSTPAAKTATWTIKTDLPGVFRDAVASPAKIRVSANDSQAGNPVGTGDSANFTLDTKNPTSPAMKIDSTLGTNNLYDIAVTDDSSKQMRFANASNIDGSTCSTDITSVSYETFAATKTWTLAPDANGVSTVCYQFKDAYANESTVTFAATPATPASPQISDISQVPLSKYRDIVWWTAQGGGVTYKVYRDSGSGYALLSSVADPTNYCFDEGDGNCTEASPTAGALTSTTAYSYKIRAEDADGISSYSSVVSAVPNGATSGEVDATAPTLSSGPADTGTGLNSTTITWTTNENSYSLVLYGTTTSLGSVAGSATESVTSHSVALSGLSSGTAYYYQIMSADASGNLLKSPANPPTGLYTFTTTADTSAPTLSSGPSVTAGRTSATVQWTTSEASTTQVKYIAAVGGSTSTVPVTATTLQSEKVTEHYAIITGLTSSTTYNYQIISADASGNTLTSPSSSPYLQFTTQGDITDITPPVISAISSGTPTISGATITWTTDEASYSLVEYGPTVSLGTTKGTVLGADYTTNHSVALSGLNPGTTYYFRVHSSDTSGNLSTSSSSTFTTAALSISGSPSATPSRSSAIITWVTNGPADSRVEYGTASNLAGSSFTSWQDTANKISDHIVSLGTLSPDITYYYRVISRDGNENSVTSSIGNFETTSGTKPVITAGSASPSDNSANITFSATSNNATALFLSAEYEASASKPSSFSKESANTTAISSGSSGTVALEGLSANTKYYYKLKARDAFGNTKTDDGGTNGYSFTTTIDSTAPAAISSLSVTAASSSSAALTWTSPGDDNATGTATSYDIRYSTSAITADNWASATQVDNEPKPAAAGTSQSMTVTGLNPTGSGATYYFAVKTSDDIPNTSSLSNVVSVDIPAQADTAAPVISSVTSGTPSATTVTVTWVTNKASSSLVDFGTTISYGTTQGNSADSVKNHSVTLIGLAPNTAYKFRVKSVDSSGNVAINDNSGSGYSFTTATSTSGTLPIISSVSASSVTATSAVVSWTTSVNADTTVGYSADPEKTYAQETGNSSQLTSHSATLTNLAPSTKYYYRVKSRNGNQLATLASDSNGDFNFTTLTGADTVAPLISNVQVTSVTATRAAITWTTNENANSYIEFGLAVGSYASVQGTPSESVLSHSVQLTSLTPETTYYFQVKSLDAAGNRALDNNSGAGYSFTTTSGSTTTCPPSAKTTACPACETCSTADVTAPKIASAKAADITFNSATISWTTDEASSSMVLYDKVSYGVKQGYGYSSGQLKDSQTTHKVTLNNLDSNTTYYFRVSSADSRGNTAESEDQSFKTFAISEAKDKGEAATVSLKKQFEDIAHTLVKENLATEENIKDIVSRIASPPIIGSGDPVVKEVKSYGATIVWRTDRKANSVVKFKAASSPAETLAAGNNWREIGKMDAYDINHEVELLGLAPSTTYAYQVKSQDVLGNVTSSELKTFTTSSSSSIFNVNVSDITLNSAKINWETFNLSTSLVEYGLTSVYGNQANKGDEKVKAHSVELADLSSGTNYHFRIRSVEESGNILSTEDYTFATYQLPQITKYDLGEVKDNSIELKWTSNLAIDSNIRYTDKDTNETKIIGAPEKSLDHSIVLPDLSAGKAYTIEIQGRDEAGNLAELAPFEVQTGMDIVPPEIAQVRSQAAILGGAEDKVQAIISWKTNELSTSQVLWDLGTTKGDTFANSTKADTNLTTNHIAVITNFKPGTVYRFRVVSADKFNNITTSQDYSILTPVRRQSVVQMIMSNFEKIFGWTKNLGR